MSEPGPLAPLPSPRHYMPPAPPVAVKPIARWLWIGLAIVLLALIAAAFPIYRVLHTQWHKADPMVAALHARMMQDDDAGIFSESDPVYQEQVGLAKSNALFALVRDKLGAPRSFTVVNQNVSSTAGSGTVLTLTLSTVFDKGTGIETLKLHKLAGGYRMLGYTVQSTLLQKEDIPPALRTRD